MHGVDAILVSPLQRPAFNLAAEEHLFTTRGDTVLFLYINTPAVVLGANQALETEVNQPFCAAHDIAIVRRLSGGGAVFHDEGNLNVCLLGNREAGCFPLDEGVTHLLQAALLSIGLPVTMGPRKDLWLERGKIAGTAAHFSRTRRLHHATLLYDADLTQLEAVLKAHHPGYAPQKGKTIASVPSSVTNLKRYFAANLMPTPSTTAFVERLTTALLQQHGLEAVSRLSAEDLTAIEALEHKKYRLTSWIERR